MKATWLVASTAAILMMAGSANAALDVAAGSALAKKSGCFACHSLDKKKVGPAWNDVAEKYKADAGAKANIAEWIHKGGKGRWNMGMMPAYSPRVADADIDALADFILSLKK